ncbi:MAG: ABC transporter ATP-binding protein [Candidatus Omnitrophota bacterium]
MNYILDIQNLNNCFIGKNQRTVVSHQINLQLQRREILGIIGESGCGKTMTALSLTGLIPGNVKSTCDKYTLDDKTINLSDQKQLKKIRAKKIAYIFQEPVSYLNPVLTIGDQITETIYFNIERDIEKAKKRALKLLRAVGLNGKISYYHRYAHQLSTGMNQRAMIALAIAANPKVLIADEPTSALDSTIKHTIIDLVKELVEEFNLSIIWITHDISLMKNFADRIIVMYAGRIIEEAQGSVIFDHPAHPYTKALISCLPEFQTPRKISYLAGEPPNLAFLPCGCKFSTRCPYAMKKCFQEEPDFTIINPKQKTKCYLLSKN